MTHRQEMKLTPAGNGGWTIEVGGDVMLRGALHAYTSTADMLEGLTQMLAEDLRPADPAPAEDNAAGFAVMAWQPDGSVKVTPSTRPAQAELPLEAGKARRKRRPGIRITREVILEIRDGHEAGMNYGEIEALTGASQSAIGRVVRGELWKGLRRSTPRVNLDGATVN